MVQSKQKYVVYNALLAETDVTVIKTKAQLRPFLFKVKGGRRGKKVSIPSDLFWSHCMTLRDDGELGVARPRCCVFFFAQHHHHHIISCVVIKVACSGLTSGLLFISKEEAHTRGKKKTKQSLCSLMCHKLNNKSLFAPFGKKPPLAVWF